MSSSRSGSSARSRRPTDGLLVAGAGPRRGEAARVARGGRALRAPVAWGLLMAAGCGAGEGAGDGDAGAAAGQGGQRPCPFVGPYGVGEGSTVGPTAFGDCAGQAVSLHDLCGAKLGLVVSFYGWCPSCYETVELAEELHQSYSQRGLKVLVVAVEDTLGQTVTGEYCEHVGEQLDLSVEVWADTGEPRALEPYGTTDLVMLIDSSGTLVFKRRGASDSAVRQAVEAELGPE